MRGITLHSVVPVRATASEAAEQLTQLLFAETFDILQQVPRWTEICLHADGQTGWVDTKMIVPLTDEEFLSLQKADEAHPIARVAYPMAYAVSTVNGQTFPLTAGTTLPDYKDGTFSLLGATLRIDPAMVAEQLFVLSQEQLMNVVRYFLNIPYLWGGKNAMGMDCSGFVQVIFSLFGASLPRNASQQVEKGQLVKALSQAQAGDLAFFDHADLDPTRTNISHVGILLDSERIVHCSGRVKVERIDQQGIFSKEAADNEHPNGQYTHHLACIKRIQL